MSLNNSFRNPAAQLSEQWLQIPQSHSQNRCNINQPTSPQQVNYPLAASLEAFPLFISIRVCWQSQVWPVDSCCPLGSSTSLHHWIGGKTKNTGTLYDEQVKYSQINQQNYHKPQSSTTSGTASWSGELHSFFFIFSFGLISNSFTWKCNQCF